MRKTTKIIAVYTAVDGTEFQEEADCNKYEQDLAIRELHAKLCNCQFHQRFKIQPYFHNVEITNLGNPDSELTPSLSYTLMRGRMGNGDDRIRYKKTGNFINIIRYSTDDDEQKYYGRIPYQWVYLDIDALRTEVNAYIKNRDAKFEKKECTPEIVPITVEQANAALRLLKQFKSERSKAYKLESFKLNQGKSNVPKSKWGVHETHCCFEHGCKYGNDKCPVVLGITEQQYPCKDCNDTPRLLIDLNQEFK